MKSLLLSLALLFAMPATASAWIHDGKTSLPVESLGETVVTVLASLPDIPNRAEYYHLMMETAAVESRCGKYDIKGRSKGSLGMMQIQLSSAQDTINWMQQTHKPRYKALMRIADSDMNLRQNLEYNVEFGLAMAAYIYLRMASTADTSTREKRASLWKRVYNTPLGAGTEQIYLQRAKECLDVDAE